MSEQVERPTKPELADAAGRFTDAMDEAHEALWRAGRILRERQVSGSASTPMFPFIGSSLEAKIGASRQKLWDARNEVAVQYFDAVRATAKDAS